jgi:hypothetical protein
VAAARAKDPRIIVPGTTAKDATTAIATSSGTAVRGSPLINLVVTILDYPLIIDRIGKAPENNSPNAVARKLGDPIVFRAGGYLVIRIQVDAPYPDPLDHSAAFAHRWPNAKNDIARHKAHLLVTCSWSNIRGLTPICAT